MSLKKQQNFKDFNIQTTETVTTNNSNSRQHNKQQPKE